MPIAYPLINGKRFDYGCVELKTGGRIYYGCKSVNYKDSLKPGHLRGTSARIMGRTRGVHEASGSLEIYKSDFEEFIAALVATGGTLNGAPVGYGEVEFTASVSYQAAGMDLVTDILNGCRITESEDGHNEGEEPLVVKVSLDIMSVVRNSRFEIVGAKV